MRVKIAEIMATKVVNGKSLHGWSGRQGELRSLKESGRTCMYPVARITPEAKALTMMKVFPSG